jgi:hypothetical protein
MKASDHQKHVERRGGETGRLLSGLINGNEETSRQGQLPRGSLAFKAMVSLRLLFRRLEAG